jgi:hypothetical protein
MSSSNRPDEVELHLLEDHERVSSPVISSTFKPNPDGDHFLEDANYGHHEDNLSSDGDDDDDASSQPSTPRFIQPQGPELGFMIASAALVLALSVAAGLTTVFDWVL